MGQRGRITDEVTLREHDPLGFARRARSVKDRRPCVGIEPGRCLSRQSLPLGDVAVCQACLERIDRTPRTRLHRIVGNPLNARRQFISERGQLAQQRSAADDRHRRFTVDHLIGRLAS